MLFAGTMPACRGRTLRGRTGSEERHHWLGWGAVSRDSAGARANWVVPTGAGNFLKPKKDMVMLWMGTEG